MKALEGVREHIARISTEGALERELGDVTTRTRIRAIRDEVRDEAARCELRELKQQLRPELGASTSVSAESPPAPIAANAS